MAASMNKKEDLFQIFELIEGTYFHSKRVFEETTGHQLWEFRWLRSIEENQDLSVQQHESRMLVPRGPNKSYHIAQLRNAGLIERRPADRKNLKVVRYRLTAKGKAALEAMRGSLKRALINLYAEPTVLKYKTALRRMDLAGLQEERV